MKNKLYELEVCPKCLSDCYHQTYNNYCNYCGEKVEFKNIKLVNVSALKEQAKKNKEVIMKWIEDMSLDGCMLIAETEFLKGQKNGELLMLKKLKKFLEEK